MPGKSRLRSVAPTVGKDLPIFGPVCSCQIDFYRAEILRHHRCLELQREYYSEGAIASAEDALQKIMGQLEQLCQREDACEVMGQVLRKLDVVTKLSAWTEPHQLH